ncbi:MAG: proline dehydrogenase family protein [candidate division Zixibacteria bacterium]|nr:proline dehydrogenase family protein [candidate division Zixibacteria bacterium]
MGFLAFFAQRFIAGETVESAITAVNQLNASGMTATLDILGENVKSQEQAIRTADKYISMLQTIADTGINSNISIKLTQMGLDISDQFCYDNVSRILDKADKLNIFVRVDMEGSDYTERTLQLVFKWYEKYKNMGIVIQCSLYRSEKDIEELNKRKITVRLCKGAYKEPKTVAFVSKDEVNANFIKLTEMLIKDGVYPAIASHDSVMLKAGLDLAEKYGRGKDDFEFQMLYGINRSAQRELVEQGYRVRVYTPFGNHWLPYYLRRMRERKENVLFILKHLFKD